MVDDRAMELRLKTRIDTQAQTITNLRSTLVRVERERDEAARDENDAKRKNLKLVKSIRGLVACANSDCDHILTTECAEALLKSLAWLSPE